MTTKQKRFQARYKKNKERENTRCYFNYSIKKGIRMVEEKAFCEADYKYIKSVNETKTSTENSIKHKA